MRVVEKLDRKTIKLPIMTSFYNVTAYTTNKNVSKHIKCSGVNGKVMYKVSKEIHKYFSEDYIKKLLGIPSINSIQISDEISIKVDLMYYNTTGSEERIRLPKIKKSHSYQHRRKEIVFM